MKIVIAGNYGADNLGDEMILEGMLSMLKDLSPEAEITVLSGSPEATSSRYSVDSCKKVPAGFRSIFTGIKKFHSTTRKAIKNCDFFILGGGGLFTHLTLRANFIWAMQAIVAKLYRKPVIMYGQSIGIIKNPLLKKLIRKIFNSSQFIALRDENSIKRLEELGVEQEIHLIPDLAFRKACQQSHKEKNTVLFALRYLPNLSPHFKAEIAQFINWLIKTKHYHINFIDFKRSKDRKLHNEIYDMLDNRSRVEFLGHPKNPEKYFYESKFVIGMRLHSIITSIKTATPFLAINYAPKVEGLLATMKFEKYLLNMAGLDFEDLSKKFKHLESKQSDISSLLKKYTKETLKEHHRVESELKRLLNSVSEN